LPSGHVIPSLEQLKKHAYYKWHNSYSHATNDCNVFHQIGSISRKRRMIESCREPPDALPPSASLSGQATNAWAMGASADDGPNLSSLGGVVQSMGATTNALPTGMVRTYSGFWPWKLLCRRWLLWTHRPSAGQKNRTVWNTKPYHPVSQEVAITLGR
jgi:hypothetical protein